ncbi:MAG: hypothetical protein MZU97_07460 [Bacillus subtilis]|nr:hypothetical protein [Bacillus subtilis]
MIVGRILSSRLVQRFSTRAVVSVSIVVAGIGFLLFSGARRTSFTGAERPLPDRPGDCQSLSPDPVTGDQRLEREHRPGGSARHAGFWHGDPGAAPAPRQAG